MSFNSLNLNWRPLEHSLDLGSFSILSALTHIKPRTDILVSNWSRYIFWGDIDNWRYVMMHFSFKNCLTSKNIFSLHLGVYFILILRRQLRSLHFNINSVFHKSKLIIASSTKFLNSLLNAIKNYFSIMPTIYYVPHTTNNTYRTASCLDT